ncbi:MAG: hypothetical protein M1828_006738 [Chrysothrix sp. TS-e1954]|nr:MAG: hypothetical protein M1828_006738 [Chrysothrix sp. TS-e1954]
MGDAPPGTHKTQSEVYLRQDRLLPSGAPPDTSSHRLQPASHGTEAQKLVFLQNDPDFSQYVSTHAAESYPSSRQGHIVPTYDVRAMHASLSGVAGDPRQLYNSRVPHRPYAGHFNQIGQPLYVENSLQAVPERYEANSRHSFVTSNGSAGQYLSPAQAVWPPLRSYPDQAYHSGYYSHPSQLPYTFAQQVVPSVGRVPPMNRSASISRQPISTSTTYIDNDPSKYEVTGDIKPRGPPRKPRQSGHALWVGNIPSGTTIVDLKDHFSRDLTDRIESLKMISKSSCAFVNYRTQDSCVEAMNLFHESQFHGNRLVCRLRRPSVGSGTISQQTDGIVVSMPVDNVTCEDNERPSQLAAESSITKEPSVTEGKACRSKTRMRCFVLKSLTVGDLELSLRTGIWFTQSHNEANLNEAFKTSDDVFLVFSANKSGEYFGYARMESDISQAQADSGQIREANDQCGRISSSLSPHESVHSLHPGPRTFSTPATEWAPRGKIIDDPARGTIFWEAETSLEVSVKDEVSTSQVAEGATDDHPIIVRSPMNDDAASRSARLDIDQQQVSPDNPFKVKWCSDRKLPFYKTRGLRNPWNGNREVKIARDGTELEPAVAEKLLALFDGAGYHPQRC